MSERSSKSDGRCLRAAMDGLLGFTPMNADEAMLRDAAFGIAQQILHKIIEDELVGKAKGQG